MTVPAFARAALDLPGDARLRPHANCYWLIEGALLAGEYPVLSLGSVDSTDRLDALLDAGVRTFIDLTEEGEGPGPYVARLRERAEARGVRVGHRRFAVPDCGIPSASLMRSTLDAIYDAIAAGEPVYVHCWGGIGRTGTVVGCLLREQGLTPEETLGVIARKWLAMEKRSRHPRSPEWPGQFAFIAQWPASRRADETAVGGARGPVMR